MVIALGEPCRFSALLMNVSAAALSVDLHVDLVQVPPPMGVRRIACTRFLRISAANIGPNRFHQCLTVSWQMSMPRSCSRSSAFRSDSGNFTYIITTSRITSGDESNQRNGLSDLAMKAL